MATGGGAEQEQELQQPAISFRSRVVGVAGSDAAVWSPTTPNNRLDATSSLETARCKSMLVNMWRSASGYLFLSPFSF